MADPVLKLLDRFDWSQPVSQEIVDAAWKQAAHLPRDDPMRERVEIFTGNVLVFGFGVQLGSDPGPIRELLIAEWKPLAAALRRGYWLN